MKRLLLFLAASVLIPASQVSADLPNLTKEPWFGYFVGFNDRDVRLGVTIRAEGIIHPLGRRNEVLRLSNPITFDFRVLEKQSDGKIIRKTIDRLSLETGNEAAIGPEKPVSFAAKVTGDAAFEARLAHDRDGYHFGGSVTDSGTLKNPLDFGIDFNFDPYSGVSMSSSDDIKKFEKMSRRDSLKIVTLDGKEVKFEIDEEVDFQKTYPDGISSLVLETERYDGTSFKLTSSKGSRITFETEGRNPVHKSLKILWSAAPGSDPAKERLTLLVK